MGIPHLYTNLRPYARPESFPPAGGRATPLYIDGPGLAHHVYELALNSTRLAGSNPWESALTYGQFQGAVIKYLDLLTSASFSIRNIYIDGHLPAAKRPTRLSRLDDSLKRLKFYRSQYPRSLRSSPAKKHEEEVLDVFSETATYSQRTMPLSAPPFILTAMIGVLSAHPIYHATVSTVPGEAESYCARDAISMGGIVLTGDSDLLLFTSLSEADWGVVMFRDVCITFPGPNISAAVFHPTAMAKSLGLDLTFLGFLAQCDNRTSFNTLKERAARDAERKRRGVVVKEYSKRWREFAVVYELPPPCNPDAISKGVEPRIAEIIQQRKDKCARDNRAMFLPFLWEDPTCGSAWDTGRSIRTVGYSLLFPASDYVGEVCRRGQRISSGLVQLPENPQTFLQKLLQIEDEKWWVRLVLEEIITVFENRGQSPPEKRILEGVAHMLSRSSSSPIAAPPNTPREWTWERIQIFAMTQAAWYSLLLLKEVLSAAEVIDSEACIGRFEMLPGVAECIYGNQFLDGITHSSEAEKRLVGTVVGAYHARLAAAREEEETADIDIGQSASNGNGKRFSDSGQWIEVGTGNKGGKGKEVVNGREPGTKDLGEQEGKESIDPGNMFAVLARI